MTDQVAAEAYVGEAPASGTESVISGAPSTPQAGRGENTKRKKSKRQQPRDRRPAMKFDDGPRQKQRPADQGRKNPDGSPSARRQAQHALIDFTPIVSVPNDRGGTTIRSETAHRLFLSHYGRAQVSLYNLFDYLPIRLRSVGLDKDHVLDVVDKIEMFVNQHLKALHGRLDEELDRIKKVARDNGVSKPLSWTREPIEVSLPIYSPQITMLMDALPKFDEICAYYFGIWLAGESSVRQRETAINHYRNDVARSIRVLMKLYHEAKSYADNRDPDILTKMLVVTPDAELPTALSPEDEAQARVIVGLPADGAAAELTLSA